MVEPEPLIEFLQMRQLSERRIKNYLLDYYEEIYNYRFNFWTEQYIARQARRADDLYRRLYRIRHGGISDSCSFSEREKEYKKCRDPDQNRDPPVEIQIIRAVKVSFWIFISCIVKLSF